MARNGRGGMACLTLCVASCNVADGFRGKLTADEIHYLVCGANRVRQLIRMKVRDDDDDDDDEEEEEEEEEEDQVKRRRVMMMMRRRKRRRRRK
jgi:hypothetical protein